MAIDPQLEELQKRFGILLSGRARSQASMMSPSEVEQILSDTRSQTQQTAYESAQTALQKLGVPQEYADYSAANLQASQTLKQVTGYTQAREGYEQMSSFYENLVQWGPMFELTMRPELARISPTFLGANRQDLDAKLSEQGIDDPFTKQAMIDNYMGYAERATTLSLSALGQLYDSAVLAAKTASEDKRKVWEKVADVYNEALSTTLMANKDILKAKLESSQQGEAEVVKSWILKYSDVGITLQDTLATAREKIKNSRIYQKEIRIPGSGDTQTERDRALITSLIAKARPVLEASRGDDGKVDPQLYMQLRTDYAEAMGNVAAFDQAFQPMLSEQERINLFKEYKPSTTEDDWIKALQNL